MRESDSVGVLFTFPHELAVVDSNLLESVCI